MKYVFLVFTFVIIFFASAANALSIDVGVSQNLEFTYLNDGVTSRAKTVLYSGYTDTGRVENIFTSNPSLVIADIVGQTFQNNTASQTSLVKRFYDYTLTQVNFTSAVEIAGFQIALWEMFDNGKLNSGKYSNWKADEFDYDAEEVVFVAMIYLSNFMTSANITSINPPSLTEGYWGMSIDGGVITASAFSNTVAEPNYLSLIGLGLVGVFIATRKKK